MINELEIYVRRSTLDAPIRFREYVEATETRKQFASRVIHGYRVVYGDMPRVAPAGGLECGDELYRWLHYGTDNDTVHRAAANDIDFETRAARSSMCNPLFCEVVIAGT